MQMTDNFAIVNRADGFAVAIKAFLFCLDRRCRPFGKRVLLVTLIVLTELIVLLELIYLQPMRCAPILMCVCVCACVRE